MADDFRCQVKQIIADFKAAERIADDISVGIVAVAVALWAVVGDGDAGFLHAVHADGLADQAAAGIVALAFYVWPCRSVKKTQRNKMLR